MTEPLVSSVVQIGVVVADAVATAQRYRELLGVEGWNINEVDTERGMGTGFVLRGRPQPTKAKFAWAMIGNVEIELIEPLDETSTYAEFLKDRGPGIHHIMFATDGYDRCVEHLVDAGVSVLAEGTLQQTRFHLFNTIADLGLVSEIATGEPLVPDGVV